MPNFFSAFTTEVFRPIATLLIPGAIGISTWFIRLMWQFSDVRAMVGESHTETILLLLRAMIFSGLVLEDFGTRWETFMDECADGCTDNMNRIQWNQYLRTAFVADPIGRRYIRTLVLRLKFELGIAFAMASAAIGLVWLSRLGLSRTVVTRSYILCLCFITWGLYEAVATHAVLANSRANLLLGEIRVIGK